MKTSITSAAPGATEIVKNDQGINQITNQKMYRDHKGFDRTHGRVNKQCIGINHDPGTFLR